MVASPVAHAAGPAAAALSSGPTSAVQLAVVLSLVSLIPAIVLSCTCFARFIVVFSMLKTGMGTPGVPPNQVLVGLAIFMTFFVMRPVAEEVYENAAQPYFAGKLDEAQALEAATPPIRKFLVSHTRQQDAALFYEVSRAARPDSANDVPLSIAVPSFMLSELRLALELGLMVLLPFLVIDLVVATVLSAMGMVMLPPTVIAVPLKLLIFVSIDGWNLVVGSLLRGMM